MMSCGVGTRPKGWKTRREWVNQTNMAMRTFENHLARLLDLGHAKKARFIDESGNVKWFFWINKLSDENQS